MKELFHITNSLPEQVQQVLSLRIGEKHLAFAISGRSGEQLQELAYFTIDECNSAELDSIISTHPVLKGSFYQVHIAYDHPSAVIIPSTGDQKENAAAILRSAAGLHGNAPVISEPVPGWQLINVYAVPEEVLAWVNKYFPANKNWHQYSVSVKNSQPSATGNIQVDFRTHDLTVVVTRQNQFLLAQAFEYASPEDVLYHLLKICDRFGLSQQDVKLRLSGLIDKRSALYKELYQYFIDVAFHESSWDTGENPPHFFTTLNELAPCAS